MLQQEAIILLVTESLRYACFDTTSSKVMLSTEQGDFLPDYAKCIAHFRRNLCSY